MGTPKDKAALSALLACSVPEFKVNLLALFPYSWKIKNKFNPALTIFLYSVLVNFLSNVPPGVLVK